MVHRLVVGYGQPLDPRRDAPCPVAEPDRESEQAMDESLASPRGRAAGADLATSATGGVRRASVGVPEVRAGTPARP